MYDKVFLMYFVHLYYKNEMWHFVYDNRDVIL